MAKKESRPPMSSLAGKVLSGKKATAKQVKSLAGSVLSQDEKPAPKKSRK